MRPGRGGREADEPAGAADSVGLEWGEVGAARRRAAGPKGLRRGRLRGRRDPASTISGARGLLGWIFFLF
jgi:hypothetical protein